MAHHATSCGFLCTSRKTEGIPYIDQLQTTMVRGACLARIPPGCASPARSTPAVAQNFDDERMLRETRSTPVS
eukprot:gene17637-biopygen12903